MNPSPEYPPKEHKGPYPQWLKDMLAKCRPVDEVIAEINSIHLDLDDICEDECNPEIKRE